MRKLLTLVAFICMGSVAFAQSGSAVNATPEAVSNTFFKAMLDEDSGKMGTILTDDFQITNSDGQSADKDLMGQALSGGYLVVESATTSDVRTRIIGSTTGVVSGALKFKGSLQSQAFDTKVAFVLATVKQGDTWKVSDVRFFSIQ